MDPTLMEFYVGNLEDALSDYDAEMKVRPAGTPGSNVTYLAAVVVDAARAVISAWDVARGNAQEETK